MRTLLIAALFLMTACVSNQYGNFTDAPPPYDFVVQDSVLQLMDLYPPAKTNFSIRHKINEKDKFGTLLIKKIRAQGYGVQEFSKNQKNTGTALAYTLDRVEDMYHLTLYADQKRLSRPYIIDLGFAKPAGSWSYKEQ